MNTLIKNSPLAMASVINVLAHNKVDVTGMTDDQKIDAARSYSAPCNHRWDAPYGPGRRVCKACGAIQDNGDVEIPGYREALRDAIALMEMTELEPTSALKQAGSDRGIAWGDDMGDFVRWARRQLFKGEA